MSTGEKNHDAQCEKTDDKAAIRLQISQNSIAIPITIPITTSVAIYRLHRRSLHQLLTHPSNRRCIPVVKKAHVPPAKKRYDEKHPTVSFRVSREGYDRLKETLNKQGKTIGQFFREALEIEERNYKEAYWRGFREARERYAILYDLPFLL